MLDKIATELARIIATKIYAAAKQAPESLAKLKQTTDLKLSGTGLPDSVVQRFGEVFVSTLPSAFTRGSTKWKAGGVTVELDFYLTSDVVNAILGINWEAAAARTDEGVRQVAACGGAENYNTWVGAAAPRLGEVAIEAHVGAFQGRTDDWGWRVLSPSRSTAVARRGERDFSPHDIFYMAKGSKTETAKKLRSAKQTLYEKWFELSDPPRPFDGPHFT